MEDDDDDEGGFPPLSSPSLGLNAPGRTGALAMARLATNDEESALGSSSSMGGALGTARQSQIQGLMGPDGAFDRASAARRSAYQQAIERASSQSDTFMERLMPWLAFSAGMMSPTRTGSFGEAMSQAVGAATPLFIHQANDKRNRETLIARLMGDEAKLEESSVYNRARVAESLTRNRGTNPVLRHLEAMNIDPNTPEGQQMARALVLRMTGPRGTNVSINNIPETNYSRRMGTLAGDQVAGGVERAPQHIETLNMLDAAREAINRGGPTGNLTPLLDSVRSAAASLGVNINSESMGRLSDAEQLRQISSLLARNILGSFSRTTDRDTAQALLQVPTRDTSREGNLIRVELLSRLVRHRMEVDKLRSRLASTLTREGRMEEFTDRFQEELGRLPQVFDDDFRGRVDRYQTENRSGETNFDPNRRRRNAPTQLPEGVPQGSTYEGTRAGKRYFRAPDGRLWVE